MASETFDFSQWLKATSENDNRSSDTSDTPTKAVVKSQLRAPARPLKKTKSKNAHAKAKRVKRKPAKSSKFTVGSILKLTLFFTLSTIVVTALTLAFVGQYATLDFIILVGAMIALTGLMVYDILSRRTWEKKVASTLNNTISSHDRLIREVARNRNDLAILKEGLAETALMLEKQGRQLPPTKSGEAKMIETLVQRLNELGELPRAEIRGQYNQDILELEMAPPPAKAPPSSLLDDAIDPDFTNMNDKDLTELVEFAIQEDKLDLYIQPVVGLPQRKVAFYELYSRIEAGRGARLPAAEYIRKIKNKGLMPKLDNMMLLRSLDLIRLSFKKQGVPPHKFFINISGHALVDRTFMGELVAFLTDYKDMSSHLIFEIPQEDYETMGAEIQPVIDGLSRLGCLFSMDTVRNRKFDVRKLKASKIRYLKFDINWLINEGMTRAGFTRLSRLKKELDMAGIDLIIDRIETEEQLRELLDYNIDYGQGYLFGKPDSHIVYRESLKVA